MNNKIREAIASNAKEVLADMFRNGILGNGTRWDMIDVGAMSTGDTFKTMKELIEAGYICSNGSSASRAYYAPESFIQVYREIE